MCRTFHITYMICLHSRVDHQPCSRSHNLFAIFQAACKVDVSEININDFCSTCHDFWDWLVISEEAKKELAHSFRIVHAYHGPLTPAVRPDGTVDFHIDVDQDQQVSAAGSLMTGDGQDEDVTRLSMLNANWWTMGDEPPKEQEQEPQSPHSRRSSASSTLTIWPPKTDPADDKDEFGHEVELESLTAPAAAHLARHELIHPDEFETVNFDELLPAPVDGYELEKQRVIGPATSPVIALSHGLSGEQEEQVTSDAEI
ncbi:hypothetical protein BKA65DRAFT_485492 [Rhexocercosporidium sp. MPI-PUGE-AT-0058]|nr:hypothetical protein BKA65DRAFT_485492 [Rhexocercosporidium sp. MPI-PUGE-AT-0058]